MVINYFIKAFIKSWNIILKNDFVQRAVFLNARNANKLWRVFKEQTKERDFIFKNTPTSVLLFLKTRLGACFYF